MRSHVNDKNNKLKQFIVSIDKNVQKYVSSQYNPFRNRYPQDCSKKQKNNGAIGGEGMHAYQE